MMLSSKVTLPKAMHQFCHTCGGSMGRLGGRPFSVISPGGRGTPPGQAPAWGIGRLWE